MIVQDSKLYLCGSFTQVGGQPRKLTDFGSQPAWSLDSKRVYFRNESMTTPAFTGLIIGTPVTIWAVSVEGGRPEALTQPGKPAGRHSDPHSSPKTDHLAFLSMEANQQSTIWEMDAKQRLPIEIQNRAVQLTALSALRTAEMLKAYHVTWFEEALKPDAFDDYVALRRAAPVPIAGGEVLTRRQAFQLRHIGHVLRIEIAGVPEQLQMAQVGTALRVDGVLVRRLDEHVAAVLGIAAALHELAGVVLIRKRASEAEALCRSATCRKAARSRPMSMKALCMPGSTRATLPR